MKRTEEQIKKDVVDQLYWDSRVDASKVKVEVDDGKVTLSGTVPTYSARRNAELDARVIPEVILVDNRIRVEYLANVPPDEEIQSNVETVLGWNPDINARNIHASVDGGWVTLEGTVDNLWHKTRAIRRERGCRDVKQTDGGSHGRHHRRDHWQGNC
jgi:osmotically-inducible protein OsmY